MTADRPEDVSTEESHEERKLSLDRLNAAFSSMMGEEADIETQSRTSGVGEEASETESESEAHLSDLDDGDVSPRRIFEAMLFVGNPDGSPLEPRRVAELVRGVSVEEVEQLADELNQEYIAENRPYRVESDGAGFRMALDREYEPLREKFQGGVRHARLSQAAIEVLSIVAYNQPITRKQIEAMRDAPCRSVLTQMVRRQLLAIERDPSDRRKTSYRTTERFLELFGLEQIGDLPQAQDVERR